MLALANSDDSISQIITNMKKIIASRTNTGAPPIVFQLKISACLHHPALLALRPVSASQQRDLQVRIPVQRKQGCLHLLVDSTGIK